MAGLVGSSASPISGIGIIAVILVSLAAAQWLGLAVFVLVCVGFYRRVLAAAH